MTQTAALPITFPVNLISVDGRRWLGDGSANWLTDCRTKLIGRIASQLPKPGRWMAGQGGFRKLSEVSPGLVDVATSLVRWAATDPGVACTVLGDWDALYYDQQADGMPDPQEILDSGVLPWIITGEDGANLGTANGHAVAALVGLEKVTYRFAHDPAKGIPILLAYWERTGAPCMVLAGCRTPGGHP